MVACSSKSAHFACADKRDDRERPRQQMIRHGPCPRPGEGTGAKQRDEGHDSREDFEWLGGAPLSHSAGPPVSEPVVADTASKIQDVLVGTEQRDGCRESLMKLDVAVVVSESGP